MVWHLKRQLCSRLETTDYCLTEQKGRNSCKEFELTRSAHKYPHTPLQDLYENYVQVHCCFNSQNAMTLH